LIQLDGDAAARRLLAPVLDWSAERIGVLVGGCGLFSPRLEPIAQAWGSVPARAPGVDIRLADRLQGGLLAPSRPAPVAVRLDADPVQAPVVELDLAALGSDGDRLEALLNGHGLSAPLLAVLRGQGRIVGMVWLCRPVDAPGDQHEGARGLRLLQPLLELAYATAMREVDRGGSGLGELAERGLTPQELVVAELAIGGAGNAAIATDLAIAERTVKNHMTRILAKCGVRSRTQLIAAYQPRRDIGPWGEMDGTLG
jgi:DNA-binding CsgD family transcriptional regulator